MFALGIYEWNRCNRIVSVSKEWRDFAVEIVDIDCRRECTMIALATRDGNEGQSNGEYFLGESFQCRLILADGVNKRTNDAGS
jgi:hypothetical protein